MLLTLDILFLEPRCRLMYHEQMTQHAANHLNGPVYITPIPLLYNECYLCISKIHRARPNTNTSFNIQILPFQCSIFCSPASHIRKVSLDFA